MPPVDVLLTAEQFATLPDPGRPCELVEGEVLMAPPPSFRHGEICSRIVRLLGAFVESRQLGRVLSNDSGVVTRRNPDTVRGADVAFYSYQAVPRGEEPEVWPANPPELVFEVRSPEQPWAGVHQKVAEYLEAGVRVVCVVDYRSRAVTVHPADQPPRSLALGETLTLPGLLEGFALPLADLFA